MFNLDDKFLEELGLASLPQDEKDKMKAHIYETLEMRVGMRLASGMTDAQLDEFESFINGDIAKATAFMNGLNPKWQEDSSFTSAIEGAKKRASERGREFGQADINAVTSEYAALKWLETNFPDYKQVVSAELEKLKAEIKQAAPQILQAANGLPEQAVN